MKINKLSRYIFVPTYISKWMEKEKLTYNRIKELLAKRRKSNLQLANYMNVKAQTVSGWCTNQSQPEIETFFRIAEFLEVEAGELLTLKEDLKPVPKKKKKVAKAAQKEK